MTQWFEAYGKWPPINQLLFSCVAILSALVLLFLVGVWTLYVVHRVAVLCRGWPPKEGAGTAEKKPDIRQVEIDLQHVNRLAIALARKLNLSTENMLEEQPKITNEHAK